MRRFVGTRAKFCCEYCRSQQRYSMDPFSAEHIVPRASGGADGPGNLAWSCLGCNWRKATATTAVDPLTRKRVRLFDPRRDRWSDHFIWDRSASLVLGVTARGRATVATLKLNRSGVVELRRILLSQGLHPP
jgi:hypothetical protein